MNTKQLLAFLESIQLVAETGNAAVHIERIKERRLSSASPAYMLTSTAEKVKAPAGGAHGICAYAFSRLENA